MSSKERIIGLDLVRSVAILLVMIGHSLVFIPNETARKAFTFDLDGVSVFFVLSGFLIGNILLKSFGDKHNFKSVLRFWAFRWAKTLPSYYVVLFGLLIYYWWTAQDPGSFSWKYVVFMQNFTESGLTFFKESWSLSVEEWFYLSFPLLFLVLLRFYKSGLKALPLIVLLYFGFSFFMRIYGYETSGHTLSEKEDLRKIVLYRFDAISVGIFLAYLQQRFPKGWLKHKVLLLLTGLAVILFFELNYKLGWINIYPPAKLSLEALAVACCIPYFSAKQNFSSPLLRKIFTYVSTRSYALYLLNLSFIQIIFLPVFFKYVPGTGNYRVVQLLSYWIFSFLFAEILYRCVEKPVLNFRNRYR